MAVAAEVDDVYEIVVAGELFGQTTANVLQFACLAPDDDVETNLVHVFGDNWVNNMMSGMAFNWHLTGFRWKQVSPTVGDELVLLDANWATQGSSTASLPSYSAALISKRSLHVGRSGRGRIFIPGIPRAAQVANGINPMSDIWDALTLFTQQLAADHIHEPPVGPASVWHLMVLSRKEGGNQAPFPFSAFHQVKHLDVSPTLATMRSRKPR